MKPALWLVTTDGGRRTEALVFEDGLVMVLEDLGQHVLEGVHLRGDSKRVDEYMNAACELLQPVTV